MNELALGLDTFGDITLRADGSRSSDAQTIRDIVDEAVRADEVVLSFFGVGEHHRHEFAVSSPELVLAAAAARTEKIHLGTAVTVLSSDDPVRVYERFATLDAISDGRAEVILGRGSFIESFPLFGYDLDDYEILFEEKLDLFMRARAQEPITWSGQTRASLENAEVYPHVESGLLKAWIAVGGSPQSVIRTAQHGLPLMLAIIGGEPLSFAQFTDLYRRALDQLGNPLQPIGVHMPGHVAETDEQAIDEAWPFIAPYFSRIFAERGGRPITEGQFRQMVGPDGAYAIGSPETVARKIARTLEGLGASRFDLKYANGTMPHSMLTRSIELYGTQVAPLVRDMLA